MDVEPYVERIAYDPAYLAIRGVLLEQGLSEYRATRIAGRARFALEQERAKASIGFMTRFERRRVDGWLEAGLTAGEAAQALAAHRERRKTLGT